MGSDSTIDEAVKVWPALKRYRKLIVSAAATTVPVVVFLISGVHSTAEIAAVVEGWLLTNLGVYGVPN